MFLQLLIKLLTTEAAKQLAVLTVSHLAKKSTTTVDDAAVRIVAKALDVECPDCHKEVTE